LVSTRGEPLGGAGFDFLRAGALGAAAFSSDFTVGFFALAISFSPTYCKNPASLSK
jgi:hypothetical protein